MSARYNSFFVLSLAAALAFTPAFANAPPNAAPRTPVTVQELPPVSAPSQPVAAARHPAALAPPLAAPAERPLWRRPELYAWIALFTTFAAFATTLLYLRRPDRNVLRAAAALTAASGVFVAGALVAWLV